MTISKEKLSRIEKDAEQLINNLGILKEKIGSYSVAKETLEKTKNELTELIDETRNLIVASHEIVKETKKIGAIEISKQLDSFNENNSFSFKNLQTKSWLIISLLIINLLAIVYFNFFPV